MIIVSATSTSSPSVSLGASKTGMDILVAFVVSSLAVAFLILVMRRRRRLRRDPGHDHVSPFGKTEKSGRWGHLVLLPTTVFVLTFLGAYYLLAMYHPSSRSVVPENETSGGGGGGISSIDDGILGALDTTSNASVLDVMMRHVHGGDPGF